MSQTPANPLESTSTSNTTTINSAPNNAYNTSVTSATTNPSTISTTSTIQSSSNSKKQLYEQTSQYRNWRFSKKRLKDLREQANKSGVERVKKNMTEDLKLAETAPPKSQSSSPIQHYQNSPLPQSLQNSPLPASLQNSPRPSYTNSPRYGGGGGTPEDVQFLTADEELVICQYYEMIIQQIPATGFSEQLRATAIVFMKRFYLRNTVMDYHPKMIMLASLFLAAKCENSTIGHEEFRALMKKTSRVDLAKETLFQLELALSQSMNYEYAVHHPHKSAYGLYLDMQSYYSKDIKKIQKIYEKSKEHIKQSLLTDLTFFYQPSQIAMGCMRLASRSPKIAFDFDAYIREKFSGAQSKHSKDVSEQQLKDLFEILDDIEKTIESYTPVDKKKAQEYDLKLRSCKNPAKDPTSYISQKRKAIEKEEREAKRLKKQAANKAYQEELELVFLNQDNSFKSEH
ncbi:9298_t:CDS:1 [Ambispora leptoticha]|uniref:9298_t:CDS:1 n=1 Tax=Ambispora leptoticha TaxID=144679 RepID=A0A9N9FXV3_9GLOM|nr:9298_t:CDS:1 [Ambispora leptoticha]